MNSIGGFQYHCFNCGFKAGWSKGKLLSNNTKQLFNWLGMPDSKVSELMLTAMREREDLPTIRKVVELTLQERTLPDDSKTFTELANEGCTDPDFINAVTYIVERGFKLHWYNWMWTPAPGYKDRVLIPFYNDGKIVGYTGRKIKDGKPKYLTDSQGTYLFNIDAQHNDRQYVIVVEGQFDAIAVDGVAIMTNEPNEAHVMRLRQLGKEVIVVPDRDKPGAKLIKAALDNDWAISLPEWEHDIKDVADAVKRYGRVYTLLTIIGARETNKIKIELEKKKLERMDE